MYYDLFLIPLFTSFVIAVFFLIGIILLGRKFSIVDDRIGSRHLHQKGTLRFGGVAIILAFILAVLIDKKLVIDPPLMGLLLASIAILFFGVFDDLKQVAWSWQLLFQIMLVVLVYLMGSRLQFVTNPFGGIFLFTTSIGLVLGLIISIVWVVFLINAINWIDGIDGVAGGIAFIGGLSILLLSMRPEVNQPPITIITAILLGAFLAFLLFNFFPAKIIAGTSGSMFMGFILGVLGIFAGAKIATTLLVLTVPIIDAIWVIGERWTAGVSIFSGDKRHLHFRLLELGWSQRNVCLFYYLITIVIAFIALNTRALGKISAIFFVALVMFLVLIFIRKKIISRSTISS